MEEIDINEVLYTFWKKKFLIIAVMVLGAILGFVYSKYIVTPMYDSSTSLVLSKANNSDTAVASKPTTDTITQSDVILNQKLVTTYSEIIKSRSVLKEVISNLSLKIPEEQLSKNITVSSKKDTELLEIVVSTESPELSAQIANELAKAFTQKVKEVYNIENVSVIDIAEVSIKPANINLVKTVGIFVIGALFIVCFYIFVTIYFNTTIKSQEDIEKITGLNVIAIIPKI